MGHRIAAPPHIIIRDLNKEVNFIASGVASIRCCTVLLLIGNCFKVGDIHSPGQLHCLILCIVLFSLDGNYRYADKAVACPGIWIHPLLPVAEICIRLSAARHRIFLKVRVDSLRFPGGIAKVRERSIGMTFLLDNTPACAFYSFGQLIDGSVDPIDLECRRSTVTFHVDCVSPAYLQHFVDQVAWHNRLCFLTSAGIILDQKLDAAGRRVLVSADALKICIILKICEGQSVPEVQKLVLACRFRYRSVDSVNGSARVFRSDFH